MATAMIAQLAYERQGFAERTEYGMLLEFLFRAAY